MLRKHTTDFLVYCKVTGFSDSSIQSLHASLKDFAAFVDKQDIKTIKEIGYSDLSCFVASFKEPSIHKKKARVWSMHQFFHFLVLTGQIKENIALGLPYPKIEKTVPRFLTMEEFNRIIEFLTLNIESTNGLRDLVIILMFGLLGLRTGTVAALNVEHIDIKEGLAWITEKGRRQRQIVLPELLNTLLHKYIIEHHPGNGSLFFSNRKRRISPRILHDLFRRVADELGIKKRLHAHLFRHYGERYKMVSD
jgi:integrase/recombinase XerC